MGRVKASPTSSNIVTVAAAELGSLVNRMRYCQGGLSCGTGHLARNMARRGLLA